jgi:hypothetical protein
MSIKISGAEKDAGLALRAVGVAPEGDGAGEVADDVRAT